MENKEAEKLRYPIGEFVTPEKVTEDDLQNFISDIEKFPVDLRILVAGFTDSQLEIPYRKKGWTVRQVIHHVADSHMNALIRFKLTLTEDMPTIKPYFEDKWAELDDYKSTPVNVSLDLLDSLHKRWVNLLRSMDKKDFEKTFFHPEHGKEFSLGEITAMYSWHGRHHHAHINELKKRMNW